MKKIKMKYGNTTLDVSIPESSIIGIIDSKENKGIRTEEEIILDALENPIGSARLRDIVHEGEKICIVISDITRAWQKMGFYLPYIVDELNRGGIKDKDITFLCATGSHRPQTKEEHRILLGEKLSEKFTVIDHDCKDTDNLIYLGKTSFGTPVIINRRAVECDHLVLTGAIVFHDLAGWGGGKKSILPGISGYESIMANHALSLSKNIGEGIHPMVKCGIAANNPLHEDMVEAANMVKPTFLFNVIMDDKGNIGKAVAGHYLKAHETGQRMVDEIDGVYIQEKADLVIVSAGGYPKDINFYQASKAVSNAKEAVKKGGTIVLISQCIEGIGDKDMQEIIENYVDNLEREKSLRQHFTVARYIGYLMAETAANFDIVLVSDIDLKILEKIGIKVVPTVNEALDYVGQKKGELLKAYLMPHGANTLPKLL